MNTDFYPSGRDFRRALWASLGVGIVGLALCLAGGLGDPTQFFRSYLMAYLFWLGLALGCLALAMLHHLSGGRWGFVILRLLEAGSLTLLPLLLFFAPILVGLRDLYPWARPEAVAADALLQHQSLYLNEPFFVGRAIIYFILWLGMAYLLRRWSIERDRTDDPRLTAKLKTLGAAGLVLLGLTSTFSTIDWIMSLEPQWYSTIYAAMVVLGGMLAAFAFVVMLVALLDRARPFAAALSPYLLNDLGSLLLAFVMLWAYLAFSQFLLIWSGNLNQEIPWYTHRLQGGWEWVALAVALLNFVLPFLLLVIREFKLKAAVLGLIAFLLVVARLINAFWLVTPAFFPGHLQLHWLDFAALAGIGGIWLTVFTWFLARAPLLPVHDPAIVAPDALVTETR